MERSKDPLFDLLSVFPDGDMYRNVPTQWIFDQVAMPDPTIYHWLGEAVAQGLLSKSADPGDKRKTLYTITEQGLEYVKGDEEEEDYYSATRGIIWSKLDSRVGDFSRQPVKKSKRVYVITISIGNELSSVFIDYKQDVFYVRADSVEEALGAIEIDRKDLIKNIDISVPDLIEA